MKKAVSEFSTNFRMYSYSIFVYSMPHIHTYIYIYTHNPRKRLWTIYYSSHVYTFTHAYLYIQANEMAQIFGSQKLDGTKADAISMNINLDRYYIDLSRYTIDLDRYCIDLNRQNIALDRQSIDLCRQIIDIVYRPKSILLLHPYNIDVVILSLYAEVRSTVCRC